MIAQFALRLLCGMSLMWSIMPRDQVTAGFFRIQMLIALGLSVLIALAGEILKVDLPAPDWTPALLGLLTAATVTVGFALPHLIQLKNAAPIRVLRHDLPPPRLRTGITYGVAVGAMLLMS